MSARIHQITVQGTLAEAPEFPVTVQRTGMALENGEVPEHRLAEPPSTQADFDAAVQNFSHEPAVSTGSEAAEAQPMSIKDRAKVWLAIGGLVTVVGLAGYTDQQAEQQMRQNNPANIPHR